MCHRITCRACGKASYAGCGHHVEQVLKGVPRADRCTCTPAERKAGTPSLLSRVFGR